MTASRALEWRHRGWFARAFDLLEGGRTLATLRQKGMGFDAELDAGGRRFQVDVKGVLRWTIQVRDDQGLVRATLPLGWRGQGVVTLHDGRRFRFDAETWSGRRWTVDDEAGVQVARVDFARFLQMDARVEVDAKTLPEDDLLSILAAT